MFTLPGRNMLFSPRVGQRWIFRSGSGYLGGEKLTDYSILLISAAFVLMGLANLVSASLGFLESKFAARWPSTWGRLVSVDIVERNYRNETWWFPQISYQYYAQGQSVVNTRLTFGGEVYWRSRSDANRFLERYITQSYVPVYYNRDNIREAVLETLVVLLVAVPILIHTRRVVSRPFYFEGFLRVCAWCKNVENHGDWIPVGEFFEKRFETPASHGMCPACFAAQRRAGRAG